MSGNSLVDLTPIAGIPVTRNTAHYRPTGHTPKKPKRVSRWDRPKPPKDWRYFVGGFGKILIALGLLTFGFVAYQLWGTGIETMQAQNKLRDEFNTAMDFDATEATTPPETVPVANPVNPEITSLVSEKDQNLPSAPRGAIARLQIPKIDLDQYVVPGVSAADLKKGVGHFPSSPWPGQLGRAGLAGHRTTYGGPFFNLPKLGPGDEIFITLINGKQYVYSVTGFEVVNPEDSYVLDGDPNEATLLLLTCTPVHSASQRHVVYADLIPSRSAQVGVATFYDPPSADDPVENVAENGAPANDPTFTDSGETADPGQDTVSSTPGDAGTTEWTLPTETDEADPATPAAGGTEISNGFDRGWFEDPEAWPVVGAWGGALLLIYVLYRLISRLTRHISVGIVVTIAPFLYCLYFFYQGVNRLLPAGI